jgi:hypothetical protein
MLTEILFVSSSGKFANLRFFASVYIQKFSVECKSSDTNKGTHYYTQHAVVVGISKSSHLKLHIEQHQKQEIIVSCVSTIISKQAYKLTQLTRPFSWIAQSFKRMEPRCIKYGKQSNCPRVMMPDFRPRNLQP